MDSLTPTVTYRILVLIFQSREGERKKEVGEGVCMSDEGDLRNHASKQM